MRHGITVQTVPPYLSAGDSTDEVLNAHPNLGREDVPVCFEYAHG